VMASDRKNGEATFPLPFQSLLQGDEDIAPRIHVLWIVFDSDGDTDPDTDAGGDGIRQEERGGDVPVAIPEPSSGR
jgi:hypothetical protein